MANASVVHEGIPSSSGSSRGLFAGKKFWFSRTVPQSKRFKELVQSNGGAVVLLEKDADILLTDHNRKDSAPDTYSYQYVEKSVRNGKLENLEDHRAGPPPGTIRPVGSAHIPARNHRIAFSAEDDRILRNWMRPYEKAGERVSGNKIYHELSAKHPHHTAQSWRSRYVRIFRDAPQPAPKSTGETTTPNKESTDDKPSKSKQSPRRSKSPQFTEVQKAGLLEAGDNIMGLNPSELLKSFSDLAKATNRTSEEWQDLWVREVRPKYLALKSKEKRDGENSTPPQPTGEQLSPSQTTREKEKVSPKKAHKAPQATSSQTMQGSPSSQPESSNFRRTKPEMTATHQRPASNGTDEQASNDGPLTRKRRQERGKRDPTPVARSPQPSVESKNATSKRRKTTIAVEIPVSRPDNLPRASLPSYRHSPSAQLLGAIDSFEPVGTDAEPKTADKNQRSGSVSSSHRSQKTPQTDEFEDAHQFQGPDVKPAPVVSQPPDSTDNYVQDLLKELPFPLPIPPGSDEDDGPGATRTPENEEEQVHQTEQWIDSRLKSGKASNESQLIRALRCCSMEPHLADKVLKSLKEGKGIPSNMKGVWTADDDEALHAGAGRDTERLLDKHGDDFYQKRQDYFRLLHEVENLNGEQEE